MALTINERKERYYNLVLNKANQLYSLWETSRIKSKQLVAQANKYAVDNRLETDANHRFHVLVFAVAMWIRLDKRYGTFFRRLFRIFAYLRERKAFKNLKIVFGIAGDNDIRELLEMEVEKIVVQLSHLEDRESTGGGKRAEIVDITFEEELDSFIKECIQEEEQKALQDNLDSDEVEKLDNPTQQLPEKTEETKREKISVSEIKNDVQVSRQKKQDAPKKVDKLEKQTTETLEKGFDEKGKTEKTIEKTIEKKMVSTSVLPEIAVATQDKKEDYASPVPIFREESESKGSTVGKEDLVSSKEKSEPRIERDSAESFDKAMDRETEREKSPFPVFREAKAVTVQTPEKVEIKETREMLEIQPLEEKRVYPKMEVSEENKARIALNVTMSTSELHAIVEQIKSAAGMEMERVEEQWREKTSIANGTKQQGNVNPSTANKGAIVPGPKK